MNENLQRLLPNPFATDYTGKIADETMVDLYTEKELEKFARSIVKECIESIQATSVESVALDRTIMENCCLTINDIKKYFGI